MRFVLNKGNEIPMNPSFICSFPSHGNVGQLAADVIIATLAQKEQIERIGYIESDYIIPMSGYDEFSPSWGKTLCMPIEVVIQQRAPCIQIHTKKFIEEFMRLIQSYSYKHLLVLCGGSTDGLSDEILTSNKFFRLDSEASVEQWPTSLPAFADTVNVVQATFKAWPRKGTPSSSPHTSSLLPDPLVIPTPLHNMDCMIVEDVEEIVSVEGSPLVNALISTVVERIDAVTVLGKYCNEGNNVGDGIDLAVVVFKAFELQAPVPSTRDLRFPLSWSTLFGPPLADDSTLF